MLIWFWNILKQLNKQKMTVEIRKSWGLRVAKSVDPCPTLAETALYILSSMTLLVNIVPRKEQLFITHRIYAVFNRVGIKLPRLGQALFHLQETIWV